MARPTTATRRIHTPALDAFLDEAGLTQEQFAKQYGLSASALSNARAGRRLITESTAEVIRAALDLPTAEAILWPINAVERAA